MWPVCVPSERQCVVAARQTRELKLKTALVWGEGVGAFGGARQDPRPFHASKAAGRSQRPFPRRCRWNTFLEEFAKEYSEGRETSKPWEAGASSKEGAAAAPDKAEAAEAQRGFAVDLEEAADAYFLLADVPGLEKSALSVCLPPPLYPSAPLRKGVEQSLIMAGRTHSHVQKKNICIDGITRALRTHVLGFHAYGVC